MATKRPYTRHTNSADRRIDEGAQVLIGQSIVKPDHKKGATVPGIQPVTQPSGNTSPPTGTPPPADPQPPTGNQPANDTPKPEPSGTDSTK